MQNRETGVLLRKELRQLLRSPGAVVTALVLPMLLIGLIPTGPVLASKLAQPPRLPQGIQLPPGLLRLVEDPSAMALFLLPMMIGLGGITVPSSLAPYALTSERESRTLELLVSLPVSIGQILWSKLLALWLVGVTFSSVFFVAPATALLVRRQGVVGLVGALYLLLLSALLFAVTNALLIALVAKDLRTSNNLVGLTVAPALLLSLGLAAALPPTGAALVLSGIYLVGAALSTWLSLRVVTFERLLQ